MNGVLILPQIERADNWKAERLGFVTSTRTKKGPPGEAGLR